MQFINKIRFFILFIILLINPALVLSENSGLIEKVESLVASGQFGTAVIQLKSEIQTNPENARARLELGKIYLTTGRGLAAEKEFERIKLLNQAPQDIEVLLLKARMLQNKHLEVQNAIVNLYSNAEILGRVRAIQAQSYLIKGKKKEASYYVNRAVTLAPNSLEAQVTRIRQLLLDGKSEQAKQLAIPLLEQHPHEVDLILIVSAMQRSEANYEKALKLALTALQIQPANRSAWLSAVQLHLQLGKIDEAKKLVDRLAAFSGEILQVRYYEALVNLRAGDFASAENAAREALRIYPSHQQSRSLLGNVLFQTNQLEEAEKILSELLQSYPRDFPTKLLLANVYLKTGQADQVIDLLYEHRELELGQLQATLGFAYIQMEQYGKSKLHLQQAARLMPENPVIQNYLALAEMSTASDSALSIKPLSEIPDLPSARINVMKAIQAGQISKALDMLNTLLAKYPEDAQLHNMAGRVYMLQKQPTEAEDFFNKAVALNPDLAIAYVNLAELKLTNKQIDEAKRLYEKALFVDTGHVDALMGLARIADSERNMQAALEYLNRARNNNPMAIKPRMILNNYFLAKNEYKNAKEISGEMARARPDDAIILSLHARNQILTGRYNSAALTYQKIIELQPDNPQAYYQQARIHTLLPDLDRALVFINKAIDLDQDYLAAYLEKGRMLLQRKDMEQASNLLQLTESKFKNNAKVHEFAGELFLAKQDYEQAASQFKKAISINATAQNTIQLFQTQLKQVKHPEAHNTLLNWLQKHPADDQMRIILADSYYQTGQFEASLKQYKMVQLRQPKNADVLNNMALVYDKMNHPLAVEFAEIAFNLKPRQANVVATLGWILLKQGNKERALMLLENAVGLAINNKQIRYRYAVALHRNNLNKEATDQLNRLLDSEGTFPLREEAKKLLEQIN